MKKKQITLQISAKTLNDINELLDKLRSQNNDLSKQVLIENLIKIGLTNFIKL